MAAFGTVSAREGDDDVAVHLLPQVARGDRAAMEVFYHLYQARVYRFALTRLDDEAQAADVLHCVMLRVWRNAHRLVDVASIRVRLLGFALEAMADFDPAPACETEPATEDRDGDEAVLALDAARDPRRVQSALKRLSPTNRTLLHLHFHENLSAHAIAEVLGSAATVVARQVAHARRLLMHRLAA